MTEIVTPRKSTSMPLGNDRRRRRRAMLHARRHALGAAPFLILAAWLPAGCGNGPNEVSSGGSETCTGCTLDVDEVNVGTITGDQHLYLKFPDGTKYEISVGKDASGDRVMTPTLIGR